MKATNSKPIKGVKSFGSFAVMGTIHDTDEIDKIIDLSESNFY